VQSNHQPSKAGVLVIAELAQSYEGSFSDAQQLIRTAAASGADAVKFQVFQADELAVPEYKYFDLYRKLEFTPGQWAELFTLARNLNLQPIADVFGLSSLAMLCRLEVSALKIHSADLCNRPLLEETARSGKTIILSCGGSTSSEIVEAVSILTHSHASSICLMHGYQASPTAPEDTAFAKIRKLKKTFNLSIGFADHIAGDHPLSMHWPLLAIAAGADVIEKHLTLNRTDKKEDYISALNPDEFHQMVGYIRLAELAMGSENLEMNTAEAEYRLESRKRVVASRELESGVSLQASDLSLKRIAAESDVFDPRHVIGRVLKSSVKVNTPITESTLEPQVRRYRLVAALACRSASSRLYAKPLHRIGSRTILEHLIDRIQATGIVDQIVLAISEGVENEVFVEFADKTGLDYVRGDESDVQHRLILAGENANADILLRATTESPFLYTENLKTLLDQHIEQRAALTVCEGLPDGSYCELIDLRALKDAHDRGEKRHRSELCTLYMFEHPERYKTLRFQAPAAVHRPDLRLTVDYPEDLIVCREIATALEKDDPLFSLESIIKYLDANPRLNALNKDIQSGIGRIWN
jgi:N,N'-diacetyllegionaminate synthase